MPHHTVEPELAGSALPKPRAPSKNEPSPKEYFAYIESLIATLRETENHLKRLAELGDKHQSLLSRAAAFWDEVPTWAKAVGGIVLAASVALSIWLGSLVFITLSVVSLAVYAVSSFLLANHAQHAQDYKEQRKEFLKKPVDLLVEVVVCLAKLNQLITQELTTFQGENKKLSELIQEMEQKNNKLSGQLTEIERCEQLLSSTQSELEQVKQTFESSLKEQSALLHQSQKELKSLMSRLNEQEQEHSERMVQMTQANQDLSYQVERARLVCGVLHDTNNKFIDLITKDKEQSEAFVKRFEEYLEGKVKSFDEVLDALCATTDELSTVSSKANANASEQDKLLKLHAHLLERLGHAVDSLEEEQPPLSANRNGFYAQPKEHLKTVAMPSEVLKVKA